MNCKLAFMAMHSYAPSGFLTKEEQTVIKEGVATKFVYKHTFKLFKTALNNHPAYSG
jgi:hypothetical protein